MSGTVRNIISILWCVAAAAFAVSCTDDVFEDIGSPSSSRTGSTAGRVVEPSSRRVLLLYSAGYNNLSKMLEDDVKDLKKGYLPQKNGNSVVLVFSKRTNGNAYNYSTPTPAHLIRLYSSQEGKVVSDTVRTWPSGTVAASPETLHDVLSYVNSEYPSNEYGLVFSSHASGWLPKGFYSTGEIYMNQVMPAAYPYSYADVPVPYVEREREPGEPVTRSIGMDNVANSRAYEMNIEDFAAAIPMKMDYIIMDACLMGGIEVAYALKDKCDRIIFSQAEVIGDGLCEYDTMASRLLAGGSPDYMGFCEDSYQHYAAPGASEPYTTISMIDCTRLDGLADVCAGIFSSCRSQLAAVKPGQVQGYFRFNKHWFYDLEDIFVKAGVPESSLAQFRAAMDQCVLYKAATPTFISIPIETFCGLSMYLPANGSATINDFYRTLSWNKATSLVTE